jgi:hypothetical protein
LSEESAATVDTRIRLLDVHLALESEDAEALRALRARYAAPEFGRPTLSAAGEARSAGGKGATAARADKGAGAAVGRRAESGPRMDLEDRMTLRLLEETRNFLLIHAAALAWNGRGVILVGPPFAGKTTLALGLVERGLEFYSDDLAPLLRGGGVLYPYRRAAAVRTEQGGREFHDLWKTGRGSGQEPPVPCRLGWVFILGEPSPPGAAVEAAGAGPARWTIIVSPGSEGLERELAACEDLKIAERSAAPHAVRFDLVPAPSGRAAAWLRELIARHSDRVVYAGPCPAEIRAREDWSREPVLARLTRREAALEILRHTLNRGYGAQLQRLYGTHPHLKAYVDILEALEAAACYRVLPGRLGETLDLLLQTIDREDPRDVLYRGTAA